MRPLIINTCEECGEEWIDKKHFDECPTCGGRNVISEELEDEE